MTGRATVSRTRRNGAVCIRGERRMTDRLIALARRARVVVWVLAGVSAVCKVLDCATGAVSGGVLDEAAFVAAACGVGLWICSRQLDAQSCGS